MVPAVLAVAAVGGVGLQRIHRGTTILADDRLRTVQDNADLVSAAYALHETALLQLAADSPETDACVSTELDQTLIPRFESAFTTLRRDYARQPDALRQVDRIHDGQQPYLELRRTREGRGAPGATASDLTLPHGRT